MADKPISAPCERIKKEYEELKMLNRSYATVYQKALETGDLTKAKKRLRELKSKRELLDEIKSGVLKKELCDKIDLLINNLPRNNSFSVNNYALPELCEVDIFLTVDPDGQKKTILNKFRAILKKGQFLKKKEEVYTLKLPFFCFLHGQEDRFTSENFSFSQNNTITCEIIGLDDDKQGENILLMLMLTEQKTVDIDRKFHEQAKDFIQNFIAHLKVILRGDDTKALEDYFAEFNQSVAKDENKFAAVGIHRELLYQKLKEFYLTYGEQEEKRLLLFKFIEKFVFSFLAGKTSLEVENDLTFDQLIQKEPSWPIKDKMTAEIEKGNIQFFEKYFLKINFGKGDYTTGDESSFIPAPEPDYQSFIKPGNTFDQDKISVDNLESHLLEKYPRLNLTNIFFENGDLYEKWLYTTLDIDLESIKDQASHNQKDLTSFLEELLQEISRYLTKAA